MPFLSFYFPLNFLFIFVTFDFSSASTHSSHHDGQSLLAFKNEITSDPHASMANWTPALPFCNWTAVTCSRRHMDRVISLNLSHMDLGGSISPSLGNLSFLHTLDLSNNLLHSYIPRQLGRLFRLKTLALDNNHLEESIPSDLGNCTNLVYLALSYNNLTGTIPRGLGSLTHLQQLFLGANSLTGNIPTFWSNISTLIQLGIYKNKLTGRIPQEFGFLTNLQIIYLYRNELSGTIPTSLSNISSLIYLSISTNKLSGRIPQELGILSNLQSLHLYENELSGTIPTSLSNISTLIDLQILKNKLSGRIPQELGILTNLQILYLCDNELSGTIPTSLSNISTLSYLILANNMIEGNIPPYIGNLISLTYLNLSGNILNGSIPSLRNLKNLERLCLGNNKLEGNIPNDFEQLQRLRLLDISKNKLSGKIPNSLAPLKQLRDLLLHHNQLSGSIPPNLGNCTNLEKLDLSHNMLTGSIPREIVELYNLHFYLNLSWNLLEGSLPMEIGKITMAQAIDISANHLTGVIPSTLGSCVELFSLNLSRNSFQGSIPDSLEKLQSLISLDLSSNSLSGTIPTTLNKLKMLQYLNLSFNKLTGEIPKGGFFSNQSNDMYFNGNPDLCGPQVFQLSACPAPRGHPTIVKRVLLAISGSIAFILCCLLLRFLWRGNMHAQSIGFSRVSFQKLEHQRMSYEELHIATNGFNEANLLGKGSFGLVYKGILNDGTLVAVKVFQLQNDQAEKSFKQECSVLQKVRHRNLVKIITSCSNLHFKSLVFQFMSNGSLEKHLYPDRDGNNGEDVCELGLKARLDIAIDVAHAIEYLHWDSFVQVVHCDIKPSNVLLDRDMSAHVTDFGIAKVIGESFTTSLTSTLALRGSMGYIAPEYGLSAIVSTQGDVYSYGILLLEILTRKQPTSAMFVGDLDLHNWVNSAFPNRVKEVIDTCLFSEVDGNEFEENNVYKCLVSLLHVGLHCSKHSREERPTMKVVVALLESIRKVLIANSVTSSGLRRSLSNLLSNSNATRNDALASNDQSYSTF